jgi:hypothetical protein
MAEFKKSFELLTPSIVKGLNKSWLKFHPFCMGESEKKPLVYLYSKSPFFYQPKGGEI